MTAAPVSRENGSGNGRNADGRTSIELTGGEVDRATDGSIVWNYNDPNGRFKKDDPIGVNEMARRKMLMTKEGRYLAKQD